jgi:hypothetical protein
VANDLDPNRLYVNTPGGQLGFHFVEEGRELGVADPNAGMGVARVEVTANGKIVVVPGKPEEPSSAVDGVNDFGEVS